MLRGVFGYLFVLRLTSLHLLPIIVRSYLTIYILLRTNVLVKLFFNFFVYIRTY
nr:MAG TPA: hypothetical protein [Caudoviricetes sp.]